MLFSQIVGLTLQFLLLGSSTAQSTSCGDLSGQLGQYSSLSIVNASLVNSQEIAQVITQSLNISDVPTTTLTGVCRVQAEVAYNLNDTISVELWLPSPKQWNGRYIAVGNGGLAGTIDYVTMLAQLEAGFAVAAGDSGHTYAEDGPAVASPGSYVPFLNSIQQTTEWIHNSMATLTPPTQQLTALYYGKSPSYNYYYGCSTGGAQGFALAQYHPELFDGIYAGSPGNWYSHLILSFLWNYVHAQAQNSSFIDAETLNLITNATIRQCDAIDGVRDGVIENPLKCSFNITSLQCGHGQAPKAKNGTVQCVTPQQVATYNAFRQGPKEPDTGLQIYPGFDLGSESGWLAQETSLALAYAIPILQNLVFKNLTYDYQSFSFNSTDVDHVNSNASPYIDEISPDLLGFRRRGAKMITTQGWADQYNAATWPIDHLNQINTFLSGQTGVTGNASDFYRLFMVPGAGHCGASPAYPNVPATYHVLDVLMPWVEKGVAPTAMQSSNPPSKANITRKLCPWPHTAKLVGSNQNDWTSYQCE
ncbi:hypothetical protein AYL99_07109 [Fonsecaea erecta]|uniref:Carboxylic ester hydrolase n=1 Tax=Fonsecaea erecta TaxID=1367422 RepID=A0A178ZE14_9EURO|nr:hypothetical protein AYL99_07109 [Fonsecaea erecta]OAP58019.1 hypothetical protein AYL99_07109 [Fonsecaea erecta]